MDRSDIDEIRARIDIVELIGGYTALKRAGSKYKGLCPFHSEKSPSFHVDPATASWHCFGACATGGDAFAFLQRAENITFPEAKEKLAAKAGVQLQPRGATPEERAASLRAESDKDRVYAVNAAALRFFQEQFRRDSAARDYAARRGLTPETLENFQIGWAPDDWSQLADFFWREKTPSADAELAGLIMASRLGNGSFTDRFRGRLIFPIIDVQERVVGFGGRLIADKEGAPKYLNSPETPVFSKSRTLYGLNRARKALANPKSGREGESSLLVVEGYMDVVAAHQAGIENVVATLGTAMTDDHVRMIRKYGVTNVVLSFDADEAGVKAALRAVDLIAAADSGLSLCVLALPSGEDPDSMLRTGDTARFRQAIDEALTVPEFRLNALEVRADIRTDAGLSSFLRETIAVIASVADTIEQDRLIRRMARFHPTFGTSSLRAEESLRAEVRRNGQGRGNASAGDDSFGAPPPQRRPWQANWRGNGGGQGKWNGSGPQRPFVAPDPSHLKTPISRHAAEEAEQTILRALLSDEWSAVLLRSLDGEALPDFASSSARRLCTAMLPLISGKEGLAPSAAIRSLADLELADYAVALRMDDAGPELSEATIVDALRRSESYRQQREMEQIRARIGPKVEGNAPSDDELLRQWAERARTLKGGGAGQDPKADE